MIVCYRIYRNFKKKFKRFKMYMDRGLYLRSSKFRNQSRGILFAVHLFPAQVSWHTSASYDLTIEVTVFMNYYIKEEDLFLVSCIYECSFAQETGLGSLHNRCLITIASLHEMPRNLKNWRYPKRTNPFVWTRNVQALACKNQFIFMAICREYAANVRLFEVTGVGSCLLTAGRRISMSFWTGHWCSINRLRNVRKSAMVIRT